MTIDQIFTHYEVPKVVQHDALLRGAFVRAIQEAWVGPTLTWPILVKALIFSSLGDNGAHIRKKIGLDKYTVTLITRGQPKFADTVATSHDLHQKLYAYGAWTLDGVEGYDHRDAWEGIKKEVEHYLLHSVVPPTTLAPATEHALRAINILHYKNPSV